MRLRARLKILKDRLTGLVVLHMRPGLRAQLLADWTESGTSLPERSQPLFQVLSKAIDAEYYAPGTTTLRREALKALCMGSDSGVRWAQKYLKRGFPDHVTQEIGMFTYLEEALSSTTGETVHQLACCSGREVAYYAQKYPQHDFIGSDVDREIVDWLRAQWAGISNLRFETLSIETSRSEDWENLSSTLLVASGGLHYMDHASLARFFSQARESAREILLSQPCDVAFRPNENSQSHPRIQLSWNHPYKALLQNAGWTLKKSSEYIPSQHLTAKNYSAWGTFKTN